MINLTLPIGGTVQHHHVWVIWFGRGGSGAGGEILYSPNFISFSHVIIIIITIV